MSFFAWRGRRVALWTLLSLLLLAGCPNRASQEASEPKVREDVPPPRALLATLTLRNPRRAFGHGAEHLRALGGASVGGRALLGRLLVRVGLPPQIEQTLDLEGTLRLFFLRGKEAGASPRTVLVLPLRSPDAFVGVLKRSFVFAEKKTPTGLQLLVPKPGASAGPMLLRVEGKEAILPGSEASYAQLAAFLAGRRARALAQHDLLLSLHLDHFSDEQKHALGRAAARVQGAAQRRAASSGRLQGAVGRVIKGSETLLRSASRLALSVDVDKKGLDLRVRVAPQPDGALAQALASQRPGPLFALDLLPRRPAVFWSLRGPSLIEISSPLALGIETLREQMDGPTRLGFDKALEASRRHFAARRTFALSLRRSAAGQELGEGWEALWLAEVNDASAAHEALTRLADVLQSWAKERMRREAGKEGARAITRRPFSAEGARGMILSLEAAPKERATPERALLAGRKLNAGWAIKGTVASFVVGQDVGQTLRRLAGQMGQGGARRPAAALAAISAERGRTGVFMLSLTELLRLLAASGVGGLRDAAPALRAVDETSAPRLSWGVGEKSKQLDLHLRVERVHFLPLKAHLAALLQAISRAKDASSKGISEPR